MRSKRPAEAVERTRKNRALWRANGGKTGGIYSRRTVSCASLLPTTNLNKPRVRRQQRDTESSL